ncbi:MULTISPECIES: isoaspartyl peptidase/L-asparaginase family protein [Cellulophaga]|uniref:N(4)-(Beta-N-acetylglucosaminyl)-L-asparaginase n=2 Tax=Cellulophaga TaxID=104264 RepID=F0RC34_CELLC|nr:MULTISPECIES: N(4)-(beta-N-acetylglucosaminyl)-L-asparaginase [Cellulophaga]ADY29668.1 N(4)-(beta-N-acetylglucosaminyl)-L-asparaginase [Cellulophaga lytica DSM 7489]AIM60672.1 glycosylasparaginase [Cellulophaga lytica]APU10548.1 glycosylasparaginase [Cellulophaga lytica]EWH15287.1 N(4)-(beta-N-acetylglucosaminyl)-L-asparaginase [Cellulophaga geojensis KL-A]TVZ07783.1 N4-(beta-N-acetylglucosaminyl)-L-asparaginase [Cellulophaga sp. RHA_52]
MKRRKFLKNSSLSTAGIISAPLLASCDQKKTITSNTEAATVKPIAICTWNFKNANDKAWEVLAKGGNSLDAVEQGVMVEEADANNNTVGLGGRPDRDGNVTLDACIMDKDGNCGSVVYLQNIVHPVSVARKVMEETPHIILAGKGAEQFAYEQGFKKENLLTEKSKKDWLEWKKTSKYETIINIENHDTIGMLAMDKNGDISGACTTSGMAYKVGGRIGDSPIIGAGLFVDNEVGGATATGVGEEVIKTVGSFLIVELMRQGKSPQEACEEGVKRIMAKNKNREDFQIGFLAMNKKGETGGYCVHPGFTYRKTTKDSNTNEQVNSFYKKDEIQNNN